MFADLAFSRRLERAEGMACRQFAEARRNLFPDSGAEWMECAGAYAVFDTVDSPVTQTFGLGIFEQLTESALDRIERFFLDRGAPVQHEVSPLAGVVALDLLCERHYKPIELSSVMYRPVALPHGREHAGIGARLIRPDENRIWGDISARGWAPDHPELLDRLRQFGVMIAAREQSLCFLAEQEGQPAAAGALFIHDGVALFAGASALPEFRRRGLQAALLRERMRCAFEHNCDMAMMVADAGSASQRNAERQDFRIAYTRTKWRLCGS